MRLSITADHTLSPLPKILSFVVVSALMIGCSDEGEPAPQQNETSSQRTVTPQLGESPQTAVQPADVAEKLPPQKTSPAKVFRPDDTRPQHDDAALAQLGIHLYESPRLKLYTDIPPESARPLPALMDQAYEAWVEYFGQLPPNRAGSDYQMTGYIMRDRRLFLETGLLPEDLPDFPHGRHQGAEFWMNDQKHDYYLRHLMVHEGTHCFMTTMPHSYAPSWYIEGMAELFGTHYTAETGETRFRIMPEKSLGVRGWGRLQIIANEREAGREQSLDDIFAYDSNNFVATEKYAWSWALCQFLDTHPRYRERFRELGGYLEGTAFVGKFQELFLPEQAELNRDWAFFAADVDYGYDVERSVIQAKPAQKLEAGEEITIKVAADRGWQSSGIAVEAGRRYQIFAEGTVVVAEHPRPWQSAADGVTIRYHADLPLCMLVARVVADQTTKISASGALRVGKAAEIEAKQTGTLFFRVNDFWGELADNSGSFEVRVKLLEAGQSD